MPWRFGGSHKAIILHYSIVRRRLIKLATCHVGFDRLTRRSVAFCLIFIGLWHSTALPLEMEIWISNGGKNSFEQPKISPISITSNLRALLNDRATFPEAGFAGFRLRFEFKPPLLRHGWTYWVSNAIWKLITCVRCCYEEIENNSSNSKRGKLLFIAN